jgi:hypothetical protein
MNWKPLELIGPACQGKFIRLRRDCQVENIMILVNRSSSPKLHLRAGAIGYCYSAPGVIHVGFTRDFTPQKFISPTQYDYAATFSFRDMILLEIET